MRDNKTVLIINDVTGYGKVSSLAMIPIMSKFGIHPYLLPTAIVSNTMDYGSCEILDTADFMSSCISKWNELGFKFNNISTGLINSSKQFDVIRDLILSCDSPVVMVDPIMADDGKLYPGMYDKAVDAYRKLAKYATILVPNFTEATMLCSLYEGQTELNDEEYRTLSSALLDICPGEIVISGCKDTAGRYFNLVADHDGNITKLYYELISSSFVGTGDVFSATLFSYYINGSNTVEAVQAAASIVAQIIRENLNNPDHFDLRIEKVL